MMLILVNCKYGIIRCATSRENLSSGLQVFGVHECNKIRSYTEKIKISVSFMLLPTIFKFLPSLRLSHQKTNISCQFGQFGLVQRV